MRRLSRFGLFALVVGLVAVLAGCAPQQGTLLRGSAETRLACARIVDYSVPMVTALLTNTGNDPVTVTDVTALRPNNLSVVGVRVGKARPALGDVVTNTNVFYAASYHRLYPAGVTIPPHATYQLVALLRVKDHAEVASLSAFEISYKQGWGSYSATTRVGYELSSRLNACESDAQ